MLYLLCILFCTYAFSQEILGTFYPNLPANMYTVGYQNLNYTVVLNISSNLSNVLNLTLTKSNKVLNTFSTDGLANNWQSSVVHLWKHMDIIM